MRYLIILLATLLFVSCDDDGLNQPSDELTSLPTLDVHLSQDNYQKLFNSKLLNTTVTADVTYDGKLYECYIRPAGSGSRYHARWGFKVTVKNGDRIEGLTEFNLSSQVFDRTMLNTYIASIIYAESGFPVSQNNHIFMRINGEDFGLYPLIERVEPEFFTKHSLPVNEMFKLSFEAAFSFDGLNYPEYIFDKKIPDDKSFTTLHSFINAVDTCNTKNLPHSISAFLNVENYLKYHTITSIMNNYDAFTNNFFLYTEQPNGPFNVIPWDFDKCFTREDDEKLYGDNAIIRKLLGNAELKKRYKEIMLTILNSSFTEQNLYIAIDKQAAIIKDAYNLDPYLGKFGRFNFDYEVSDLKDYIKKRREYLLKELDNF